MDVHHDLNGATAEDVYQAHLKDLTVQEKYGVNYLTYWFNAEAGKVFCLMDAPSKDAAVTVHREAHGLIPDEIIEVEWGMVRAFLGVDPSTFPNPQVVAPSVPDTAFRTVMFTDMHGSTELNQRLGDHSLMDVMRRHNTIIRDCLSAHAGREVKHTGDGFMSSFVTASRAVECAMAIQRAVDEHNRIDPSLPLRLRVGLSAGEPVEDSADLFGAAVTLAARTCDAAEADQILVTSVVRDLCIGKTLPFADIGAVPLKGFPEPIRLYEVPWRN
jgi:class 3 adenylate cyclase